MFQAHWTDDLNGYEFANGFRVMHILPESTYAAYGLKHPLMSHVVIIAYSDSRNEWVSARVYRDSWDRCGSREWSDGAYRQSFAVAAHIAASLTR